jgi:Na+-transporting NADH:ubiquinone oxidoreductase subunit F
MIVSALLFMNGFAVVISALIIFMDRVVSNYGECRIVINGDKEFHAQGGRPLLRLLLENSYFIPSACGGKGTCGYCKLKVDEGGGAASPTEMLILSRREGREGFRLACQLKVKNDLHISIPPEYLEIREYAGEITTSELVTSDIIRLRIKLLDSEPLAYKAGQYIQIRIDHAGGTDFRAYSMASNPAEGAEIEINVKRIPDGIGSGFLHARSVGDHIELSGPYGDFFLRTDSARTVVCVAGGVGLAPLKSIVLYWRQHQKHRSLELYYGARTLVDLYDHDFFVQIAAEEPDFHYFPALSDPDDAWRGETGFIHTVLGDKRDPEDDAEAYLCGPPIMIEAVTDVLKDRGVPEERIWYDKF